MFNPFRLFKSSSSTRIVPLHKRKVYVPDFCPVPRLEILLNQYIELYEMDTSMSLDRDGHTLEQIEHYTRERIPFVVRHGHELLEYLRPYEGIIPKGKPTWLLPIEVNRYRALGRLKGDFKKIENEQS